MATDYPAPVIAAAQELSERAAKRIWPIGYTQHQYDLLVAIICEALLTAPLPEWSQTMFVTENDVDAATPTKPGELPEEVLREACAELNKEGAAWSLYNCRHNPAVRTVARLLVRIKELEGPKEDPDLVLARESELAFWKQRAGELANALDRVVGTAMLGLTKHTDTIKHLREAGLLKEVG